MFLSLIGPIKGIFIYYLFTDFAVVAVCFSDIKSMMGVNSLDNLCHTVTVNIQCKDYPD